MLLILVSVFLSHSSSTLTIISVLSSFLSLFSSLFFFYLTVVFTFSRFQEVHSIAMLNLASFSLRLFGSLNLPWVSPHAVSYSLFSHFSMFTSFPYLDLLLRSLCRPRMLVTFFYVPFSTLVVLFSYYVFFYSTHFYFVVYFISIFLRIFIFVVQNSLFHTRFPSILVFLFLDSCFLFYIFCFLVYSF